MLIAAVGSRGDTAPLTGLGTALRGAGHNVTVAAFGMFEELVTGCGLGFRLVPGDPRYSRGDPPVLREHDRYIRWPGAALSLANVQPGDGPPDQHPLDF
jgi:UDP:flavonoid glycosyltransferase YjiC (YdhE family)